MACAHHWLALCSRTSWGDKISLLACDTAKEGDCSPYARLRACAQAVTGLLHLQGHSNEDTSALIEAVNQTGKAFLITTDLAGQTVARIACGGFMTQVAPQTLLSLEELWQLQCSGLS